MTVGAILYGCPQSVMVALVDYFLRVALGGKSFDFKLTIILGGIGD